MRMHVYKMTTLRLSPEQKETVRKAAAILEKAWDAVSPRGRPSQPSLNSPSRTARTLRTRSPPRRWISPRTRSTIRRWSSMPAPRTGGAWTASCTDGGRCRSTPSQTRASSWHGSTCATGPSCRHRIPRGAKGSGSGRLPFGLQRLRLRRDCDGPRREVEAPRSRLGCRAILESKNLRLVRIEPPVFAAAWKLFVRRSEKRWSFTDCTSFVLMENLDLRKTLAFRSKLRRGGLRDDSLAGVLFGSVVREVPSPARGPLLLRARRGPPWKATLRGLLGGTSRRRTCSPGRAQAKSQIPDLPRATGSRTNRRAEGTTPRGRPRTGRQATPSERPWPGGPRPRRLRPRSATRRVEFVLAAARSWPRRASPRCPPPR